MPPVQFQDYYGILGVDRTADADAIRRAFRKKAREHHPDVNRDVPEASERFREVNEAHDVLSDPEKRAMYDRFGQDWQRYRDAGFDASTPTGARSRASGSATSADFEQWFTGTTGTPFETSGSDSGRGFSDFFNLVFGQDGGRANRASRRPVPVRGQDIEVETGITLDEAARGTTRRLTVRAPQRCDLCDGTGTVRESMCPRCDGTGTKMEPRTIEVAIPAGVATGSRVRARGQGGAGQHGGPAGDVYLKVSVAPSDAFQRSGDDLRTTVKVPLYTAMLGGEVKVPTLASPVMLTVPPETRNGRVFRLRGKGMPRVGAADQRGDLLAVAEVELPTALSDDERELFARLRNLRQ